MERLQGAMPRGRVSQGLAAATGSFSMFAVNRYLDPAIASASMYFIPTFTLITLVVFGELEERIREGWSDYRERTDVNKFVVDCDEFLKDENLDDAQKEDLIAKKNQARMSVIDNKFHKITRHGSSGKKIKAKTTRRVNPKAADE